MSNQTNQLNLPSLFRSVTKALTQERQTLNETDTYNHDHGDNMVEVFKVISQAMQERKNADPADQLAYASQLLRQQKSGSAQLYSQGLSRASEEFKGQKQVTPDNAMSLIQALMGGGQPSRAPAQSGMGNLLGSLLGGGQQQAQQQPQGGLGDLLGSLLGGDQPQQQQPQQPQGGMGNLLGSLLGGQQQTQSNEPQGGGGFDLGDLANAGMAYMSTKSEGGSNMDAIINAVVSRSAMSNSQHRSQSGALVVNTLLQAIGGLSGKK
jgi:hypothetical protein